MWILTELYQFCNQYGKEAYSEFFVQLSTRQEDPRYKLLLIQELKRFASNPRTALSESVLKSIDIDQVELDSFEKSSIGASIGKSIELDGALKLLADPSYKVDRLDQYLKRIIPLTKEERIIETLDKRGLDSSEVVNIYAQLKKLKMDGLAGALEALKGDISRLQSTVQKFKITDKELAGVAIYTTIHPEWDSSAIADILKEKTATTSWDRVISEIDSASGIEVSFRDVASVVNLLKFLSAFDTPKDGIIKRFLLHSWQRPGNNAKLVKSTAEAVLTNQVNLPTLSPVLVFEDTAVPPQDQAIYESFKTHALNKQELIQVLVNECTDAQVLEFVNALDDTSKGFILLGITKTGVRDPRGAKLFGVLFESSVLKLNQATAFALKQLSRMDKPLYMKSLIDCFEKDSSLLSNILFHSRNSGTLTDLLSVKHFGFTLELASLADKTDVYKFEDYLRLAVHHGPEFIIALLEYLEIHATLEYTQSEPGKAPLGMNLRSVASTLQLLSAVDLPPQRIEHVKAVQIQCLQLYPRLINFGQGHDAAILANGDSNNFSEAVENQMKMYYQKMYAEQMEIRDIIQMLQRLKQSDIPSEQDVFACMVHSLFDEYRFFPEYPLQALATTAVLFGSLVYFQLIQGIPLSIALQYILESLKNSPDNNMFKFGLQALFEFRERLGEFPKYCSMLLDIPGLKTQSQFYQQIQEIVAANGDALASDGANALLPQQQQANTMHPGAPPPPPGSLAPPPGTGFHSVVAEVSMEDTAQEDPVESIADKVLFVVNNIASNNVQSKTKELSGYLEKSYYRWFASYIVGQRSKQEPNYHSLYITMITLLGSKLLEAHITEVTYIHIIQLLNSPETVSSSEKRTQLKNLGQWLGSLLLSRDKPILHKNIYFKGLLLEGYNEEKLAMVLPFVCKTLEKAQDSSVFRPPNPWLMGIMNVLAELYEYAELKLNLKFEIEVLCKNLNLDLKSLKVANFIRSKPGDNAQDLAASMERMRLNGSMPQQQHQPHHDPAVAAMGAPVPPPPPPMSSGAAAAPPPPPGIEGVDQSGSGVGLQLQGMTAFVTHAALRRLFLMAIDESLREVLQPLVNRTVNICAATTKELIGKDFALEPDENKLRMAGMNMVRVLAANLAVVSSKEMLSEHMINHLRSIMTASGYGEHAVLIEQMPLAVSDNLEVVTSFIERAAIEKAQNEIDEILAPHYRVRAHHRETRPNQVFADPQVPAKYPMQLPDPFLLTPGGLMPQQLAIYETFGSNKINEPEVDPYQQQRFDERAASAQSQQQQQQQQQQPAQVLDATILQMQGGIEALEQAINESTETSLKQLTPDHPIMVLLSQMLNVANRCPYKEQVVLKTSQITVSTLFTATKSQLGREVLCLLLDRLCELSAATAKEVVLWLIYSDDERKYDVDVVITLIRAKLVTAREIDVSLAKQIGEKNGPAIQFAAGLIREAVMGQDACALRTEFTGCLEAMEAVAKADGDSACKSLLEDLEKSTREKEGEMSYQDQMSFIFVEWLRLAQHPAKSDRSLHVFVYRLSAKGILESADLTSRLIRASLEAAVNATLNAQGGNQSDAFVAIDALAKLIVTILRSSDASVANRVQYAKRIFSVISLVFAREHDTKLEQFNGRPYFRLFSTVLYELSLCENNFDEFFQEVYLVIAGCLQSIQPMAFPAFSFAWMTLISHRLFLPKLMRIENKQGQKKMSLLLESLLKFLAEYSEGITFPEMIVAMYKGLLRIFLVIMHDFPQFLIEYHYTLCNAIPESYVQLRNIVLSAFPKDTELPDPLSQGLKVDRLPQVRESPLSGVDPGVDLQNFGLKKLVDAYYKSPSTAIINSLVPGLYLAKPKKYSGIGFDKVNVNTHAINALVLYNANRMASSNTTEELFDRESVHLSLITQLLSELSTEGRFFLCSAIADQLRYPNRHTHFYSCAILSIFGNTSFGGKKLEIQHLVTRVLLERVICNRPHPWGLIITFTELLKNQSYKFWELPITKESPEIERMFVTLYEHLSNSGRGAEEQQQLPQQPVPHASQVPMPQPPPPPPPHMGQ